MPDFFWIFSLIELCSCLLSNDFLDECIRAKQSNWSVKAWEIDHSQPVIWLNDWVVRSWLIYLVGIPAGGYHQGVAAWLPPQVLLLQEEVSHRRLCGTRLQVGSKTPPCLLLAQTRPLSVCNSWKLSTVGTGGGVGVGSRGWNWYLNNESANSHQFFFSHLEPEPYLNVGPCSGNVTEKDLKIRIN